MSTPDEIAKMLAERNLPKEVASEEADPEDVDNDGGQDDELEPENDEKEDIKDHDEEPTDQDDQEDDGEDDDENVEEADGSGDIEYLDADDNLHVRLRVDNEEVEVPLNDLIQNYAGDKAAAKRYQEAQDFRKKAETDYNAAVAEAQAIREAAVAIVKKLDEQLHTPAVPKPDESLRQTNPARYLQQFDAYQKDQSRIKESRDLLEKAFAEHGNLTEKSRTARKAKTAQAILEAIPALRSDQTKAATMEKIFNAGKAYGFSDDEINALEDPRMYIMAYDAMLYRESTQLGEGAVSQGPGKKKKVLRAGKTRKSSKSRAAQRTVSTAKSKAQKSGRPDDVANFLVARTLSPMRK